MNADTPISDGDLEREFQKLTTLESEKLMQRLDTLHKQNPALFEQLSLYAERRRNGHSMRTGM